MDLGKILDFCPSTFHKLLLEDSSVIPQDHEVASRKLSLAQETFAIRAGSPGISHEVASRKLFLAEETFAPQARHQRKSHEVASRKLSLEAKAKRHFPFTLEPKTR